MAVARAAQLRSMAARLVAQSRASRTARPNPAMWACAPALRGADHVADALGDTCRRPQGLACGDAPGTGGRRPAIGLVPRRQRVGRRASAGRQRGATAGIRRPGRRTTWARPRIGLGGSGPRTWCGRTSRLDRSTGRPEAAASATLSAMSIAASLTSPCPLAARTSAFSSSCTSGNQTSSPERPPRDWSCPTARCAAVRPARRSRDIRPNGVRSTSRAYHTSTRTRSESTSSSSVADGDGGAVAI